MKIESRLVKLERAYRQKRGPYGEQHLESMTPKERSARIEELTARWLDGNGALRTDERATKINNLLAERAARNEGARIE